MGTLAYLGRTRQDLLASAVVAGRVAEVRTLLEEGADPNQADALGDTPLLWAAALGHVAVFLVVESHGGDRMRTNHQGDTALYAATRSGEAAMVAFLLKSAPRLEGMDAHALWELALSHRSPAVASVLAEHSLWPRWNPGQAARVLHRAMDHSETMLGTVLQAGAHVGWDVTVPRQGSPWDRLRRTCATPSAWRPAGAPVLAFRPRSR